MPFPAIAALIAKIAGTAVIKSVSPVLKPIFGLFKKPIVWVILLSGVICVYAYFRWVALNNRLDENAETIVKLNREVENSRVVVDALKTDLVNVQIRMDEAEKNRDQFSVVLNAQSARIANLQSRLTTQLSEAKRKGQVTEFINSKFQTRIACLEKATASKTIDQLSRVTKTCQ